MANPNLAGLNNNERIHEACALLSHNLAYRTGQGLSCVAGKADEDNARRLCETYEHEPAKIFVFSKENALFPVCLFDQLAIIRARGNLTN